MYCCEKCIQIVWKRAKKGAVDENEIMEEVVANDDRTILLKNLFTLGHVELLIEFSVTTISLLSFRRASPALLDHRGKRAPG